MYLTTLTTLIAAIATLTYFVLIPLCHNSIGAALRRRTEPTRELLLKAAGAEEDTKLVGFFHPYCNAGGGGERVLWAAIRAIQIKYPTYISIVYTGDHEATPAQILANVKTRFSISLDPSRVTFLYLNKRHLVAASTYPHFTLLGQSLGSLILAHEAFSLCVPDIFVDTMGYGFTLPFAKWLFGIPVAAYVHYPTISTDMLDALPGSSLRTKVKRVYWMVFAKMYMACGRSVDLVMANSTWTTRHMEKLWKTRIHTVFPPCAVGEICDATPPSEDGKREKVFLCIAQFRPEKKHSLVIESFARFMKATTRHKDAKLVLLGSVRHKEDAMRVYELRLLARELGVQEEVVFVTDAAWGEVLGWLGRSWAGVNAMWNEHFGIGVVEYLAAGLVGVVHNSGGPKLDIVVDDTGYHCETEEEFAEAFEKVLGLGEEEVRGMRERARRTARRFDEETFEGKWLEGFETLVGK